MADYDSPNPWGDEYKEQVWRGDMGIDESGDRIKRPKSSSAKAEKSRTAARGRTAKKRTARQEALRKIRETGRIPGSPTR